MVSAPLAPAAQSAVAHPRHRAIRRVAVLGAGIMGSRIALHFANIGVHALLLDIVPRELTEAEQKAGKTLESKDVRNRIVTDLFQTALKSNPSPVYDSAVHKRVALGNFTDDLAKIADVDWIIEVVVERLDIKQSLYAEIEKYRKPGTLISSNTSGIPIHMLSQGRSDDFRRHFCGTHFFNPPRYLKLLEIIPTPDTDPAILEFMMDYGDRVLGKTTVLCKDTPAFIGNRVGIFAFLDAFHKIMKHGLSVDEVDALTGPVIGRAKSATFRTSDVVGLDTAVHVAKGIYDNCPQDEARDSYKLPDFVAKMVEKKMLGDKTGGGFFKKVKKADGTSEIMSLNLDTLEYGPQQKKLKTPAMEQAKGNDSLPARIKILVGAQDKYGAYLRDTHYGLFSYVSHRIPEIADELYQLDQAVSAGYGFAYGPFEVWDILGVPEVVKAMKAEGYKLAPWVEAMVAAGHTSFYTVKDGKKFYYSQHSKSYQPMPGGAEFIVLDAMRDKSVIWKNAGTSLFDLGDGVTLLEFQTKMNTIGGEVLEAVKKVIELTEREHRALVIGNQGENFTVGANLAMVFMLAAQQEWDELNFGVKVFQDTSMSLKYSRIPVVVAAHGMTLGGGCEFSMHATSTVAAAETYMGLVEVGVGIIPGGAGTKELAVRVADEYMDGDIETNTMQKYLMNAAMAKVGTSAQEAFNLGLLQAKKDRIVVNGGRLLAEAKKRALELAEGYVPKTPRTDVRVMGRAGLALVKVAADQMKFGGYASEHDRLITEKIGYVMCGGDLSYPQQVSEQYLLDLEREAFLSLVGTKATLERIQHMLQTGKPLRN